MSIWKRRTSISRSIWSKLL